MAITKRARITLVGAGLVALLAYLVIVDLGFSAGRIHRGVTIRGINVGGLTVLEANRKLEPIGEKLADWPILLVSEGDDCRFTPRQLGWGPQPFTTAEEALEIGRADAPFGALWDRARAWLGGVTIDWADEPDAALLDEFVADCQARFQALGVEVDEVELRALVDSIIGAWPYEQIHQLPTS